jgi:hypothetical protein
MTSSLQSMLQTHPDGAGRAEIPMLAECIAACFECEQICSSCADACLSEEMVMELRYCIRTNLDCADICAATGRMMVRMTKPDAELMRTQLQACMTACRVCGDECAKHAEMHEHCRICAEACRRCEKACRDMLALVPAH